MLKILQTRLQQYMNRELLDVQLDLEKAEEPEIELLKPVGSQKKQGNSRKVSTSFSLTAKAFECVDHNKLQKNLKEMGIPDHLTCFLRHLYAGQEQQLELDVEQQTGSK